MRCLFPVLCVAVLAGGTAGAQDQDTSTMASELLRDAGRARQAITDRNRQKAIQLVKQALTLAHRIIDNTPSNATPPPPVLISVYRGNAKRGDLDVTSATDRLETAQAVLSRGDWVGADTALSAIFDSIIDRVDGTMPLLQARQELLLARSRVAERQYEAAARPLHAAARRLADFEKLYPGPQAQAADAMRQQLEDYARNIKVAHRDATFRIDTWLRQVDTWNNPGVATAP